MPAIDTYKTLENRSEGVYREKGSRFIGIALPVTGETEIITHLESFRKEHHQARHFCYAYRLGTDGSLFRYNDDGEPSGSAGIPIFNQIRSKEVTNILVTVIRYFGGTKLGVSGLINAYKTAARLALENAKIIDRKVEDFFEVIYDYDETNFMMKILSDENVRQVDNIFMDKCKIIFAVRKKESRRVSEVIKENNKLQIKYLRTE